MAFSLPSGLINGRDGQPDPSRHTASPYPRGPSYLLADRQVFLLIGEISGSFQGPPQRGSTIAGMGSVSPLEIGHAILTGSIFLPQGLGSPRDLRCSALTVTRVALISR